MGLTGRVTVAALGDCIQLQITGNLPLVAEIVKGFNLTYATGWAVLNL